jgi:uncharacterized protein with HEPN domain
MRPSLPFSQPWLPLQDISDAIADIERFTKGMDVDKFQADPKTVAAVERNRLLISEAAIRLGEQAEVLCPGLPWREIRGIGNWFRHQYDHVDLQTIWRTVADDLPPLQTSVRRASSAR